ncbi:hypothetical protein [Candidatus Nitronereus thalassa]|uniref:Lipoprotein n=1 Tax=Candidatus Nitronereus thalassa TaxID=3020898 RepID=A0ABU3KBT3_9BACT|nr:hypothetical protein [Candidatus Nitronereus thalassa]MDT7043778.1 hypothetical protein [Candidatus Nitronereus thalassa]
MRLVASGKLNIFFLIWFGVALSGCVSDFLNQYAEYDYGPNRAERMCHPYWDCQQGEWTLVGKSEIDMIVDYANCERALEIYGEWLSPTVVSGMEAGHCMEKKGYTLRFPNPLRR